MSKQLVWHQPDCEPSGNHGDRTRFTHTDPETTTGQDAKLHSVSNATGRSGNK